MGIRLCDARSTGREQRPGLPCPPVVSGVAVADGVLAAYELAYRTDPTSAFGGIIAFNRKLDGSPAITCLVRFC